MKRVSLLIAVTAASIAFPLMALAQTPAPVPTKRPAASAAAPAKVPEPVKLPAATVAAIDKRVENFLRKTYAWGSDFEIKAAPMTVSPDPDLYAVPVTVTSQGQSDTAVVYVSKNGRYMFQGELQDLDSNPFAATLHLLDVDGFASKGPANAKVTVVEFADFQCPVCRQLEYILRVVLPKYPQIRFVFIDFPLVQIHPWASTAAAAGHCALQQSSDIFWKLHDSIYDSQNLITTENASSKLAELAAMAGADPAAFQSCIGDPKTEEAIKKSTDEGIALHITGTPTVFVNGRRMVGPDQNLLEQYLKFDLNP